MFIISTVSGQQISLKKLLSTKVRVAIYNGRLRKLATGYLPQILWPKLSPMPSS